MRYIILILVALIFHTSISAQTLEFTDGPSLPKATSANTASVHDNDIYLVSGFTPDEQLSGVIYKLNGDTQEWSTFTNLSMPKRFASAEVIGDKLYVLNGLIENGQLNDKIEIFDLNDGSLTRVDNILPSQISGSVVYNNKLYTFGGTTSPNVYTDQILSFDPESQQWTEVGTLPIAAQTKGDVIDGKLYVVGGYNGSPSNQLFIYDIDANSWLDPVTMPMPNSANTVTAIGSILYIVGDFADLNFTARYNTITKEFTVLENNIISRRHCASANLDGQLWVMGGNTSSSIASSIDNVQYVTLAVSDRDLKFNTEVTISPNPAAYSLKFSTSLSDIKIINSYGLLVKKIDEHRSEISVTELAAGAYYILAKSESGLVCLNWIKQ